ncbi:alpha/beta hydrolase [Candidatus Nitrospira salsa]
MFENLLFPTAMTKYLRFIVLGSLLCFIVLIAGTYWTGAWLTAPAPATVVTPSTLLPAQSVHFSNSRGKRLAGWYIPGRSDCGTVILTHAIRSNRASMAGRTPFLHKTGYSQLLFDFQAHGESEGQTITFGYLEQDDVKAAVQFALQQNSSNPVGLIGFSLGGVSAVLNGPTLNVDVLILEAVNSRLENAVMNRIRQRVGTFAPFLAYPLLFQLQLQYGLDLEELRPIDSIRSLEVPVFVIGGTRDQHTLPSETKALFTAANSPKELWLVKGAHHQDIYQFAPADYEARVLSFLNTHLACASPMTK